MSSPLRADFVMNVCKVGNATSIVTWLGVTRINL